MKYSHLFSLIIISSFFCSRTFAQTEQKINEEEQKINDVQLYVDSRIEMLTVSLDNSKNPNYSLKYGTGSIRSAKGYRVLIYSGIDRGKANNVKADFMRRHPDVRVYMSYALPQYRIKVGDFSSREEANELYRQMTSLYSPCMVVPDIVEINTFRKND
jgi:hypothetical protein